MPRDNNFSHSKYSRSDPGDRLAYRTWDRGAPPDSLAWRDAMSQLGHRLSAAGVRAVWFVYGSYVGTDLFGSARLDEAGGLKRGYSRGIPGLESLLGLIREETSGLPRSIDRLTPPYVDDDATKDMLDKTVHDAGNYTSRYLDLFQSGINRSLATPIACSRRLWSSVHHHLGRAEGAVLLIDQLRALKEERSFGPDDRVLVIALGHAGQVLALASNLLAQGETSGRDQLLPILQHYYETIKEPEPVQRFERVVTHLVGGPPLGGLLLDVVTLGTPIRYGWDSSSIGRMLHIINHRPLRADGKRWLSKMDLPQIVWELTAALGGDYVQQLAVAASDVLPTTAEQEGANKLLWELLEPYDGFERWLECARRCVRCPNDGACLLIDYQDAGSSNPLDHVFGHACYTRLDAMLFTITEIVNSLYF